ncbi:DUF4129 domain-containing protein [Tahibacter harae]|uniref:DUF4129 domain-containing protein n=1 Tax=Tahibacter harae TaxID=2963937 RepID=A0ABT1QTV2_9GAMM|nr:DUF4129 domain-containing protein [Tahibacter harae]MCQ4165725.1 DUF4129 domain-containing protein [Tahibacter harae]
MRLEGLTVALRPRTAWEATDLGFALVRRHAGRIWGAWLLVTLPVLLLLNGLCLLLGQVWLAGLLLWWLKPVFDRVPLYILSRAVFGAAPGVAEAARAQLRWGWRSMFAWLTWRRLHPCRSLLLPVDLLEGLSGARRRERVRVLQRSTSGTAALTLLLAVNMELMLNFSIVLLGLMFVPVEFMSDAAKAVWDNLIQEPPLWAKLLFNLIAWLAMSLMEPFYVGAGFGQYLNRRTQLEAWDVELAFRRLAQRLSATAAVLALAVLAAFAPAPAWAEDPPGAEQLLEELAKAGAQDSSKDRIGGMAAERAEQDLADAPPRSLRRVFGGQYQPDGEAFEAAAKKAYADGDLNPRTTQVVWEPRERDPARFDAKPPALQWLKPLGNGLAFLFENALWILLAVLVVLLIRYHRYWLPWVSDRFERERQPDPVQVHDLDLPEQLPDDLPAAVRALWREGRQRAALALFYRAAVQRLDEALGLPLPPGATEAECLRRARRLDDGDYAKLFTRIVRAWQSAAYARRLPEPAELEALLAAWSAPRGAA